MRLAPLLAQAECEGWRVSFLFYRKEVMCFVSKAFIREIDPLGSTFYK